MSGKAQVLKLIDEQYQGDAAFWDANTVDPADDDAPPTPEGVSVAAVIDGILIRVDFGLDKAHKFPRFQEFVVYARPVGSDIDDGTAIEVCRFSGNTHVWQQPHGGYIGWDIALSAVTNNEIESAWTDFYSIVVSTFYDDFRGYGSDQFSALETLYWLQLAQFESSEGWAAETGVLSYVSAPIKEGAETAKCEAAAVGGPAYDAIIGLSGGWNLDADGRWGSDDLIMFPIYLYGGTYGVQVTLELHTVLDNRYFYKDLMLSGSAANGWYFLSTVRSGFNAVGSPAPLWSSIVYIRIRTRFYAAGAYMVLDDLRIVKASAVDPAGYSDTGDRWLTTGGVWHGIPGDREGEPPGYNYGQMRSTAAEWLFSIAQKIGVVNGRMSGRVRVQYANGLAGLVFRSASDAANCLAVILDTTDDKVWFVQWADGGAPATTNMALNPSAEAAGNFGALGGATVTQSSDYALFGSQSFKNVTTAAAGDGMTATVSALSNADHYVTFYVYDGDPGPDVLEMSADGGSNWNTCQFLEGKAGWARYEAFIPDSEANGSTTLSIRQNDDTARTFYVDGILATTVEDAPYFDGAQGLHCTWSGTAHASTSSRPAGTPVTVASADYTLDINTGYFIGIDFRDEANERRVTITLATAAELLWGAPAKVISATTPDLWPVETGIGVVCYDCKARFGEIRGGSPQTADWSHRAAVADTLLPSGVPIGSIMTWPAAIASVGWLLCDGSAVSRTTYAALYALIGDTFGNGDGSTTFNLPDLLPPLVPCIPPLEADDWNGDAKGSGTTAIDLSAEFGLPADIRAVMAHLQVDEDSSATICGLGPTTSYYYDLVLDVPKTGQYNSRSGFVNCDGGDVVFYASAAVTAVYLRITAYAPADVGVYIFAGA